MVCKQIPPSIGPYQNLSFFTVWMITIGSSLVLNRLKGPDHHKL